MAPTSVPLFSALLSIVATVVALTMQAETWRPTPLFAADRPKFPFGGKRREPEPVEEGPGLLDEVAGGRYGGGQASLPATTPAPSPGPATPLPPYRGEGDDGSTDGSGTDGVSYDDGIMWAPAAGGEATLSAAPPAMPVPGEPGWPSEMGLLEAIANMPDQSGWNQPPAGWSSGGGGTPATPPLPLGTEPVPPFADLAPAHVWEVPAAPAPAPPTMPAWEPPAPFASEPPASAPSNPADDPDSWHSWQWQTAVNSPDGDPLPSPETVPGAGADAIHAAWEAAERGLDPTAYAMPASSASDARPSIWAAPAAPVVDAWAAPAAPAAPVDEWGTPPPPPPPPPAPFAEAASGAAGNFAPPPPPPPLSAPPSVAPLEATWDFAPRVEPPAPASWDAAPADAAPEPLSALWDLRAPDLGSPATGDRSIEPWFDAVGDPPTAGFSFSATTLGHAAPLQASTTDERFLAADPPAELLSAPAATDEWESLRGAFAGPDDASSPATALRVFEDEDIDDADLGDGDRDALVDLGANAPIDDEWQIEPSVDAADGPDLASVGTAPGADEVPAPVATRMPSSEDDPWWGIEPLDGHDPFAIERAPTFTDATGDAARRVGSATGTAIDTEVEDRIERGTDDIDTQWQDPFVDGAGFTSVAIPEIEADAIDERTDDPSGIPSGHNAAPIEGPWGDELIDRLRLVVGPTVRAADHGAAARQDDAAPTTADSPTAPIVPEASFEARFARGLRLRLTDDEVVAFLDNAMVHVAPEADVHVLVANGDGAFDRDAATGSGGRAGCGVARANRCPAIVGGETLTFTDSTELDACPHLAARGGPACAAVCVPLPSGAGVVHLTTSPKAPLGTELIGTVETVAALAADRLTELRAG